MYEIVGWREHYEVSAKGRMAASGEELRKGPLDFVRLRVNGRTWGESWRALIQASGPRAASVFGVFCKLLELAADLPVEQRGRLVGRHGEVLDGEAIARLTGFAVRDVERALVVLCSAEVGWVARASSGSAAAATPGLRRDEPGFEKSGGSGRDIPGNSGTVREIPEQSGKSRLPLLSEAKRSERGKEKDQDQSEAKAKGSGFAEAAMPGQGEEVASPVASPDLQSGGLGSADEILRIAGLTEQAEEAGLPGGARAEGRGKGDGLEREVETVVRVLERVTQERCWRANGHLSRIRGALDAGGVARARLWGLLDRIEERNPGAKGLDVIENPGAFVVRELKEIEGLSNGT